MPLLAFSESSKKSANFSSVTKLPVPKIMVSTAFISLLVTASTIFSASVSTTLSVPHDEKHNVHIKLIANSLLFINFFNFPILYISLLFIFFRKILYFPIVTDKTPILSIIYFAQQMLSEPEEFLNRHIKFYNKNDTILTIVPFEVFKEVFF